MADCRVKNQLHAAIYETIRSLIKEDPNVNSLSSIITWFSKNYPDITREQILDSLVLPSPSNVKESTKELTRRVNNLRRQGVLSSRLDQLLNGTYKRKKGPTKTPPSDEVNELSSILNELTSLAIQESDITATQYGEVMSRIENIRKLYQQHYDTEGAVSEEAINRAVENLRTIRREMRLQNMDKRIAELQNDIRNLKDPDNIDINSLITDNTSIPYKPIDDQIFRKQQELQELRGALKDEIAKLNRQQLAANGINLFGFRFKNRAAQNLVDFTLSFKDVAWELPRTLAFMFDASAFGVQLAPVVVQDLVSPVSNFYKRNIMGRDDVQVFQGWNRLRNVWIDGFWNVLKSDYESIEGFDSLKRSKGAWTRDKFREVLNHPLYQLMSASGLKISQSKSLTDSEEFFQTSLVNRWPVAGWIKDVSEDTMVTTLNLYRVSMFEQFHRMNPDLTPEEYAKVAEHINNLTGTTNNKHQILSGVSYVMSAPRLMVARVKLALQFLAGAKLGKIDIPKTLKEGGVTKGIKFQSTADAFMFNHLAGLGASYGAFFGLVAMASMAFDGLDFGEDWEESDFLRVRLGPTSFDVTGGMGAVYRTLAKMIYLTQGPSDNASPMAKERINYLRSVKGEDAISAMLQFGRYKLHPTIGRTKSIITGTDFLGRPYDLFGETEGLAPNAAAALRALMPIFLETTIEQYFETPRTGLLTDTAVNLAQFFGVNTFEYGDASQDVRVNNYFNEIEYKPDPRYPEMLGNKEDSTQKEWLKNKYREMWGNALGELVMTHGADPERLNEKSLKFKWGSRKKLIDREFMKLYGEDIKRLTDKPKKNKTSSRK